MNISVVWKVVLASFIVIKEGLVWEVDNSEKTKISTYPWVGWGENYLLPKEIFEYLNANGIYTLNQVVDLARKNIWA